MQFDNVSLAVRQSRHDPGSVTTLFKKVRTDEGHVVVFGNIRPAVNQNDRDAGLFGFLKNIIPAALDERCNPDDIHFLGDERSNGFDLVFLFLLGIRKSEFNPQVLRRLFNRGPCSQSAIHSPLRVGRTRRSDPYKSSWISHPVWLLTG